MFYVLVSGLEVRQELLGHLRTAQILGVFHYLPLHLSPMGRRLGGYEGQCPVTEATSDRIVRLPLYSTMSLEETARVADRVASF